MHVLKMVFVMLEVVVLFNLLIFVHELGHFLAARWRGLKIDRFAIWFGKPIWKTKINGVEYALGSIPAGGYVSLPQMAPMEMIEGKADPDHAALPPISALDKIIVAFAGPLFSFGLALAFALVVASVGRPVTESETSTVIGLVHKDSPAEKAGLKRGDKVLSVDGHKVTKFGGMGDSVSWYVVRSVTPSIPVEVERDGKVLTIPVEPKAEETKPWQRKGLRQIQIEPAQTAIVGLVASNSPAALAGIKPKDELVTVNGVTPLHYSQVAEILDEAPGKLVHLKILRDGQNLSFDVQPVVPIKFPEDKKHPEQKKQPRMGITWADGGRTTLAYPGPFEQVGSIFNSMFSTFGALFDRHSHVKVQQLGGAIKILSIYYLLFQHEDGWRMVLWFSVLMNVNLAFLNMLPFPVLDGGHITLAVVEAIRRRPISARFLEYVQTGCAVALISFMLYIAFYDVQDLGGQKGGEVEFAPPPAAAK